MSTGAEVAHREQQVGAVSAIDRLSAGQLAVIKNTVAKGASNDELAMFLELASRYQLDPFAREIWCVKMGGSDLTITTSRDGYLAIANRHPAYDGMEADVVREGDTFSRSGQGIEHSYGAKRGAILGAYALVYRSDRTRPAYFFATFSEYNKGTATWKTYPSAMIQKVAEAMALKRAFSISGLVTEEEMDKQAPAPVATAGPVEQAETWEARLADLRLRAAAADVELGPIMRAVGATKYGDLSDDVIYELAIAAIDTDAPGEVDGAVVNDPPDADEKVRADSLE